MEPITYQKADSTSLPKKIIVKRTWEHYIKFSRAVSYLEGVSYLNGHTLYHCLFNSKLASLIISSETDGQALFKHPKCLAGDLENLKSMLM